MEVQERRITVSGLTLRVREWPGDGPPIVLAHGLASNSRIWDDVAALIEAQDLSDVTLVAHSMAAGKIVRYLSRHGVDRIARAVLSGALPGHDKLAVAVG